MKTLVLCTIATGLLLVAAAGFGQDEDDLRRQVAEHAVVEFILSQEDIGDSDMEAVMRYLCTSADNLLDWQDRAPPIGEEQIPLLRDTFRQIAVTGDYQDGDGSSFAEEERVIMQDVGMDDKSINGLLASMKEVAARYVEHPEYLLLPPHQNRVEVLSFLACRSAEQHARALKKERRHGILKAIGKIILGGAVVGGNVLFAAPSGTTSMLSVTLGGGLAVIGINDLL